MATEIDRLLNDEIIRRNGDRFDCVCGSTVVNLTPHLRTDKHERQFNVDHAVRKRIFRDLRNGHLHCNLCNTEFQRSSGRGHLRSKRHMQRVRNARAEQGAARNEQGAVNNEEGAGDDDEGAADNEQGAARNEQGAENYDPGAEGNAEVDSSTHSINVEFGESSTTNSSEMQRIKLPSPILIAGGIKIVLCNVLCFVSSVCDWPAMTIANQLAEYYERETIEFAYILACELTSRRPTRCITTGSMAEAIVTIVLDELVHNTKVVLTTTDMNAPKRIPDKFVDTATQTDLIVSECTCRNSIDDINCQLESMKTMLIDHQNTINMLKKSMPHDSISGLNSDTHDHPLSAPTPEFDDVMPLLTTSLHQQEAVEQ